MTPYSLDEACCLDVSEELVASIIRFEETAKEVSSNQSVYCLPGLFFDSEDRGSTFLRNTVIIYQTTPSQIADDSTPTHHCENLKSKLLIFSWFRL
jgi:hypothetical protein